jgi:6-phosphogluconolactonase
MDLNKETPIQGVDERRDIVIPGNAQDTLEFCVEHFIAAANQAIQDHGYFSVALSGGSTPKGIFKLLADPKNCSRMNWKKVQLFWSDERAVSPEHSDSNYKMAMDAGLALLGIPSENIHRMVAESNIQENALAYEKIISESSPLDFVMLGMGDDGHTASLFPHTHGLHAGERLVVANYIDALKTWRMTLTFKCINQAKAIVIYVIGHNKSEMLKKVLEGPYTPDQLPSQKVGALERHALWIADNDAASQLR